MLQFGSECAYLPPNDKEEFEMAPELEDIQLPEDVPISGDSKVRAGRKKHRSFLEDDGKVWPNTL